MVSWLPKVVTCGLLNTHVCLPLTLDVSVTAFRFNKAWMPHDRPFRGHVLCVHSKHGSSISSLPHRPLKECRRAFTPLSTPLIVYLFQNWPFKRPHRLFARLLRDHAWMTNPALKHYVMTSPTSSFLPSHPLWVPAAKENPAALKHYVVTSIR